MPDSGVGTARRGAGSRCFTARAVFHKKRRTCLLDALPERISKRIIVGEGCWSWSGWHNTTKCGRYGYVNWGGRDRPAHRVILEILEGPIPVGWHVDHLCKNPSCVNPEHLEAVTAGENIRRGKNSTKDFCKHGHDWNDPKNWRIHTFPDGRSRKNCAECDRQRCRAYKNKRRGRSQ